MSSTSRKQQVLDLYYYSQALGYFEWKMFPADEFCEETIFQVSSEKLTFWFWFDGDEIAGIQIEEPY